MEHRLSLGYFGLFYLLYSSNKSYHSLLVHAERLQLPLYCLSQRWRIECAKSHFIFRLHLSKESPADIKQLALVGVESIRAKSRTALRLSKKKCSNFVFPFSQSPGGSIFCPNTYNLDQRKLSYVCWGIFQLMQPVQRMCFHGL